MVDMIPEKKTEKTYDHLDKITETPPTNHDNKNIDLHDVIEIIFPDNDIYAKSVLNSKQILAIAQADVIAETFDNDVIRRLIIVLLKLQMSFGGWSRKDMRAILSYVMSGNASDAADEGRLASLKKKLFGQNAQ